MSLCVQVCVQACTQVQAQVQVHTQAYNNIQVNALVCKWASSTNNGPFWPVFWVFDFAQAPSRSLDRG